MPTIRMPTIRMLETHRAWQDWVMMGLGVLIVLSPWLAAVAVGEGAAYSQAVVLNGFIVGALVCALAVLEMLALDRWEEAIGFVCGVWLIISPFVLGYAGLLSYWHFALGALV